MKAVMLSIQPHWCELIASGKKTLEIRKTKPKLELPFKCYIYCTNTKPYLVWGDVFRGSWETEFTSISGYSREQAEKIWDVFNGQIIGEFVCDGIQPFDVPYPAFQRKMDKDILKQSCLTYYQMHRYAYHDCLYAWHISDLKIYDEPKPLNVFTPWCNCMIGGGECDHQKVGCSYQQADYNPDGSLNVVMCGKCMTRAPQSWCYVEEAEL